MSQTAEHAPLYDMIFLNLFPYKGMGVAKKGCAPHLGW